MEVTPSRFSAILTKYLCLITAITLQIQVTLFQSPLYLGLRINLTDILAPFAGMAILMTLLQRTSKWPTWNLPHAYKWIFALSLLLTAALLNTYYLYGQISPWALLNKYLGWYILIAIMGMGAWIATNATQVHIENFLKIFFYVALAIMAYQLAIIILQCYTIFSPYLGNYKYVTFPIAGLMANRNAYGLFTTGVISFATCIYFSNTEVLKKYYVYVLYFCLPVFLAFNFSRATFITLCLMIPALLITHRKQSKKCMVLILSLLLGISFLITNYYFKPQAFIDLKLRTHDIIQKIVVTSSDKSTTEYIGDNMRLTILKDSLEMIRQHPITGSGLGSSFLYQIQKHGEPINVIDSTPMWLLTEIGAIGLGMFALFYLQVVKAIWKPAKESDDFVRTLRIALMFTIFAFSLMSLFHEIMYTRHIWFLLGFGLCLPLKMRRDV